MFGSGIGGDIRCTDFPGKRSDVYNPTPTLPSHCRKRRARAIKGSRKINRQVAMPKFVISFDQYGRLRDSSIIHQNVGITTKLPGDTREHLTNTRTVGNVASQRHHLTLKLVTNLLSDLLNLFFCASGDGNVRALARKFQRNSTPNATATASDQCNSIL